MRVRPPSAATRLVAVPVAVFALAACSGSSAAEPAGPMVSATAPVQAPAASASSSAESSSSAAASPSALRLTVDIGGRSVVPPPRDVRVGRDAPIHLVVTSEIANSVHVHGVDVERDLPPGSPVSLELRFGEPGVYEVESHEPQLRLVRFVVA